MWLGGIPILDLLMHGSCSGKIGEGTLKRLGQEEDHSTRPCKIIVSLENVGVVKVL